MKLSALYKLCKKNKSVMLLTGDDGRQWIAVEGSNLYPMDGLGDLDEGKLLIMMDVPEDEKSDWDIFEKEMTEHLQFLAQDNRDDDRPAQKAPVTICVDGDDLRPVYSAYGLVLVREDALRPVADSKKTQELFVRKSTEGLFVVVKNGFELIAVIGRTVIYDEKVWEALSDTAAHIHKDIERRRLQEQETDGEQQRI